MRIRICLVGFGLLLTQAWHAAGDSPELDTSRGDRMVNEYFTQETRRLSKGLTNIRSLEQWQAQRETYRAELLEMLGLSPLPERTEMNAVVTGKTEHEEFVVERVQFQSRPGLYVTGNLYLPKVAAEKMPAVLYVCGHGRVKKDGISYGNKANYQHHGGWFARNGYVCLTIDTLQLGEIEGIHHGTYRYDMWWWLNRGYTPAGVEAWNCVRALDYLESRSEVDAGRLGVTGRSGGGAYSWWIAAIDDRIKVAVPVAGITDLENHVVDGCVEGHCDCMFMLNTYRWDYPLVAALVAPRPLLISNTDSDGIFPLDGVVRTFEEVRRIYRLYGQGDQVALNITAGPHKDTQELRVHAFRWFNHHLKGDDSLIDKTAVKFFEPEQLKVFSELPADEQNTRIHESFVRSIDEVPVPQSEQQWSQSSLKWKQALREKCFRGWPSDPGPLNTTQVFSAEHGGLQLRAFDFDSQQPFCLRLYLLHRAGLTKPDLTVLNVLDEDSWTELLASLGPGFAKQLDEEALPKGDLEAFARTKRMCAEFDWTMAYFAPRGIGPSAWDQTPKKQTQHRRRFYLLGQTLDGMRVFDVRRAARAVRTLEGYTDTPLWIQSHRAMAGVALYAALFEPEIARLDLYGLPQSHREGPFLLNVRRFLDLPQTLAMVAENSKVVVYQHQEQGWEFPRQVGKLLNWDENQFRIRRPHGE